MILVWMVSKINSTIMSIVYFLS